MTENIIYSKGEVSEGEESDDWDDSLLVKAYDTAINLAKEQIAAKLALEKEGGGASEIPPGVKQNGTKPKSTNPTRKWKVGMSCRAEYSSDGRQYEAVIKNLDYERGTCCVKYLGYGNEEEVDIQSLRPTQGKEVQYAQKLQAKESAEGETEGRNHGGNYMYPEPSSSFPQAAGVIPPPPPPFVMANLPRDETDALSAMLMAWYMSGYHTGYYQGLTRSKTAELPPRSGTTKTDFC